MMLFIVELFSKMLTDIMTSNLFTLLHMLFFFGSGLALLNSIKNSI